MWKKEGWMQWAERNALHQWEMNSAWKFGRQSNQIPTESLSRQTWKEFQDKIRSAGRISKAEYSAWHSSEAELQKALAFWTSQNLV